MRAGKKPSLKTDKKHTALGSKPGVSAYSKKASLLEDAITQMNAGKYGRSSAVLKELLALDPQNMEARRLFATLHLRLGSLLPARQAFESLANEALERQDYWLAESLLQEYLVAGPRCVPFIEKLGIVYQEKGDELAAAEEFGKAIDILLEDPDTEHPNWPAQLYAKIRDLAPASPPAFRLASFFDAQSGELRARPAAAHPDLSETAASPTEPRETAPPEANPNPVAMPEPMSGVMPWDQVGQETAAVLPPSHHEADVAPLKSDPAEIGSTSLTETNAFAFGESVSGVASPEPAQGDIASGLEAEAVPRSEYLPDVSFTGITTASEPVVSRTTDSVAMATAFSHGVGEPSLFRPDHAAESAPVPMPREQVQDGAVTIPPSEASADVETSSADAATVEPAAVAATEAPWPYDVEDQRAPQEVEKAADSVSAPMPWEQIQDATVTIPPAEATGGVETRSDSSVATESPFVALSDAAPVDSQDNPIPVSTAPEAAAARHELLSADLMPDGSSSSQPVREPVSNGDAVARSADHVADAPPPAVVEPLSIQTPWDPVQASPANHADAPQESASSEAPSSISLPVEAQASPLGETAYEELPSEQSSRIAEPSPVEESAPASAPAHDSGSLAEHPPGPERIEKPRGTGFSWESIFSTWKYGPSSSKSTGHHAAPVDRYQSGESLPSAGQPGANQAASPAAHEVPAAEAAPVAQPELMVPSPFRDQDQESSITIPSLEPAGADPALVSAPDSVSVHDQPEAPVTPSPVGEFGAQFGASTVDMAASPEPAVEPAMESEPRLASPAQEASSLEPPLESEGFRFVSSREAPPLAPVQNVTPHGVVSHDPPVQQEEFRIISLGEETLVQTEEAENVEPGDASNFASSSAEPSVQSGESQVAAPDHAASTVPPPIDTNEPATTREILPVLPPPVNQLMEAVKESPVASPAAAPIESLHPAPEPGEKPEVSTSVASVPPIEQSSTVTEPALLPPQETDQPAHWKTGEVFVRPHQPVQEAPAPVPDDETVLPAVVQAIEGAQAIEPAPPSQAMPAAAGAVPSEPQPLPRQAQEKEAWMRTGESIRLIDPQIVQQAETVAQGPEVPGASPVASAVDELFQSSGRMTRTQTIERATAAKPHPQIGAKLARLRRSVSAFIGSCFSTTHALVMSLVGLVVLLGALAAIAIGAVGVAWVVMEEKPSPAFQRLTAAPQRSSMDSRKNGYWLLLGFDAEAGTDPIQAGHDRKPGLNEEEAAAACLGDAGDRSGGGPLNATASVADGWFRSPNPVTQFKTKADGLKGWIDQAQSSIGRYRQWLKMPFDDWGYGQAVAPPCASILYAHRLYVADGFAPGQAADTGIHRLQDDMEAWRTALGQAKTLPVKMLAVQAIQDDLAVASGLLAQPDFDSQSLPGLSTMLRPLDQVESSMRWPMQSELAAGGPATDAQVKEGRGDEAPWHAMVANWLPLPKQRRLNEYAEYYDASSKAAGEGRHSAMPKRASYIKNPPVTVMDYLSNPIENIVGLKPLPSWDRYNGMVIDVDARLRLASVQAWLRRGSQEGDLVTRIAKAGQRFYDPYTGMPMLVNLKRGVLYSVGHDGRDQDADPQQDVVVSIPVDPSPSVSAKAASGSVKRK